MSIKSRKKRGDNPEFRCRRCGETKFIHGFYSAVDTYLDTNGYMSVCKDCCNEIFISSLNVEVDVKKAILKTCKILNLAFVADCVDSAILQIETNKEKGKDFDINSLFGVYKAKLANYFRVVKDVPQTFESYPSDIKFNEGDERKIIEEEGENFSDYLKMTWGTGFTIDEYNFLETSLDEWKRTHKCETNSELVLMREICQAQLAVRKAREQGADTKALLKSMMDTIKIANLSPAQANMMNASKGNEIFGMWIKDIENLEPAEWWNENRDLFVDVDNLAQYWEDFIVRPIKNFLTRSRDFIIKSGVNGAEFEIKDLEEETDTESYE